MSTTPTADDLRAMLDEPLPTRPVITLPTALAAEVVDHYGAEIVEAPELPPAFRAVAFPDVFVLQEFAYRREVVRFTSEVERHANEN